VRPAGVAAPKPQLDARIADILVAKAFKLLARDFLTVTDFEKLKAKGIKKFTKMSESKIVLVLSPFFGIIGGHTP